MEPLELAGQSICKKIIVSRMSPVEPIPGTSCVLNETPVNTTPWQKLGISLKKLDIECHIIPLKDFLKLMGIKGVTVPDNNIPGFGSTSETPDTIVIDAANIDLEFESIINFEEGTSSITELKISEEVLNSLQFNLRGNALFTKLGELITKPKIVRSTLGFVIKFILRKVVGDAIGTPALKAVLSTLNCGDEDY